MMSRSAIAFYNELSSAIDAAERDKNIYLLPELAERLGMAGGETRRGLSQRWEYSFADEQGDEVHLECRWYDTSKTFSPGPDRHIMTVRYTGSHGAKSHSGVYEE